MVRAPDGKGYREFRPTLVDVASIPVFHPGHAALVATDPEAEGLHMLVDLVQDDHITLASVDDVHVPREWAERATLSLTYLDRFAVYTVDVQVLRVGTTRLVVGPPADDAPVERRQYARVLTPLPATCLLLDPENNRFTPFDAVVRDLGGGGLALSASVIAPAGATMVVSLGLPDERPVVVVGTTLPSDLSIALDRPTVRLEFTLVREADRDRILRFVLLSLAGARRRAR
jgi:PilZ domain